MTTKEKILSKVNLLDSSELRVVEQLIDSLSRKRKKRKQKATDVTKPYNDVIKILGSSGLTSEDIYNERQDRI